MEAVDLRPRVAKFLFPAPTLVVSEILSPRAPLGYDVFQEVGLAKPRRLARRGDPNGLVDFIEISKLAGHRHLDAVTFTII